MYMIYLSKLLDDFCSANDLLYLAAVSSEKNPDVRSRWFLRGLAWLNLIQWYNEKYGKTSKVYRHGTLDKYQSEKIPCPNMTDNQVPVCQQVYVTGHKNTKSLNDYRTLNDRHRYIISSMLSNTMKNTEQPLDSGIDSLLPGANKHNCNKYAKHLTYQDHGKWL